MGFWLFVTVMDLLVPAIMLYFGRRFQKKPPEKINHVYGYRTARSMKNQETWRFAHETCGRLWVRLGAVLLLLSLAAAVMTFGRGVEAAGIVSAVVVVVQMVVVIGSIVPVERALKRNFDDQGRKRN